MLEKYLIADLPKADALLPFLRRIDRSRRYTNFGPLTTEFEEKLQDLLSAIDPHPRHGPIHVTTMSTGCHALEVGLKLFKIAASHKVLVPAVTFPACPLAVQSVGAEPLLADIDSATWTLTPEIARAIAAKTKIDLVMPVAIYGVPLPVEGWNAFTRDTGIPVIIDAAAAVETQVIPEHGFVVHSLHATKPFGIGEGGLLIGRHLQRINDARVYSNFGTFNRIATVEGSNTKMSEYHAAVALCQLERWQQIKRKRRKIFDLYLRYLRPLSGAFAVQQGIEQAVVSSFMLRLKKPAAAKVHAEGDRCRIAFHRMYLPPLYRHPYFAGLPVASIDGSIQVGRSSAARKAMRAPHSETMLKHVIGIPFHPFMKEKDMKRVAAVLKRMV